LLIGWGSSVQAASGKGPVTGFDMPRFVSVRVNEANLRAGPGKYFPIRTVLTRRGMPVQVIDEFKLWRKVSLYDGVEGWLHQSLITGRRFFLIVDATVEMLEEPEASAAVVARLEPGALAGLMECSGDWCALSVSGAEGWVPRASGWGALAGEDFKR
jgi:SH3-like domain-containing protein